MYFSMLAEAPIVDTLLGASMGKGPALSLPSMLVIRNIIGTEKTVLWLWLQQVQVASVAHRTGKALA